MATPFRFIHCGDLHLGAPFKYLKSLGKQVNETIAESTYKAFHNIVDFTISQRVDALIISGDVYNTDDHNLEAQVRFVRELERLQEKNIPVYIVHGNHDPAGSWHAQLELPSNVYVFGAEKVERFPLWVGNKEVAGVYGISCGQSNIQQNVVSQYKRLGQDEYAIGILHGTVGSQKEHLVTMPCNLTDLTASSMDYWALGHIHKREVLQEAEPVVIYAGNTQGLHRKEIGAKGCYLVKVSANGHSELTFHPFSAIRFEQTNIDISKLETPSEIEEMIRHKKEMLRKKYNVPVLLDVNLTGVGKLYAFCQQMEVRELWLKNSQEEEKGKHSFILPFNIVDNTFPSVNLKSRRQLPDMVGDYLSAFDQVATLGEKEKIATLQQILEARPEMKRLGRYKEYFTEEMMLKALHRAELEGSLRLIGDKEDL